MDRAASGYDAATLAADMAALSMELGHERFALGGYRFGMTVGYVLAAEHTGRVTGLALAEALLPASRP